MDRAAALWTAGGRAQRTRPVQRRGRSSIGLATHCHLPDTFKCGCPVLTTARTRQIIDNRREQHQQALASTLLRSFCSNFGRRRKAEPLGDHSSRRCASSQTPHPKQHLLDDDAYAGRHGCQPGGRSVIRSRRQPPQRLERVIANAVAGSQQHHGDDTRPYRLKPGEKPQQVRQSERSRDPAGWECLRYIIRAREGYSGAGWAWTGDLMR